MLIVTLSGPRCSSSPSGSGRTEMRARVRLIPFLGTALVALATVYVLLALRPDC